MFEVAEQSRPLAAAHFVLRALRESRIAPPAHGVAGGCCFLLTGSSLTGDRAGSASPSGPLAFSQLAYAKGLSPLPAGGEPAPLVLGTPARTRAATRLAPIIGKLVHGQRLGSLAPLG